LCRVIDHDWHARYTAVDIIIIIIAVTTPAPTECAAALAVVGRINTTPAGRTDGVGCSHPLAVPT